jgi:hypothetical protein
VPRLSAAAAPHLSNPYPIDNRPFSKFKAAPSSDHGSRLSESMTQIESGSSHGVSIPAQLNDALGKELTGNTLHTNCDFLKNLLPHERLPFLSMKNF